MELPTGALDDQLLLVNSSLEEFRSSVKAVVDCFPFDVDDEDLLTSFVASLRATLGRIDSEALIDPDGFWRTFLDDVELGDYT